ncbi:MAG TPA: malto-oligosyltrehalose synthase, partial [Burkholderiaceae bacterium]|nr:malto-oligosyltrehalose synthase [Burkholderiaceae bacterium]
WRDVLKHGLESPYAHWFDIDWQSPSSALQGKVLAPFLSRSVRSTLLREDVGLVFDGAEAALRIGGGIYPLAPGSWPALQPAQLMCQYDTATREGRSRMHELLLRQNFRLASWRCAAKCINWRRFFDISDLVALRIQDHEVFDAVHELPLRLFSQGLIDGLRIDHVDGLAQPLAYCRRLRAELAARLPQRPAGLRNGPPWIVVEKILAHDETFDDRWAASGTTGYDFMDQAGGAMHAMAGKAALSRQWRSLTSDAAASPMLEGIRHELLVRQFASERRSLLHKLRRVCNADPATSKWSGASLQYVLDLMLRLFPVYRLYVENGVAGASDQERLAQLRQQCHFWLSRGCGCGSAREGGRAPGRTGVFADEQDILDAVIAWLGGADLQPGVEADTERERLRRSFIRSFQQLTPPLAAKSLEDTLFYRYGRLLSRNEVGSGPECFAASVNEFHQRNAWRAAHRPQAMLCTATHDQKRGEDARARLAVLSELSDEWLAFSRRWLKASRDQFPSDKMGGSEAERYMLLQTLVGSWPLDLGLYNRAELADYARRITRWQRKALREAKLNSSWMRPDKQREEGMERFINELLLDPRSERLNDMFQFVQEIAPAGIVNSLSQSVLRCTSPGLPDLYQGTELWDFSLVDPDSRRVVDYGRRSVSLDRLSAGAAIESLLADWRSGACKQFVIWRCLALRQRLPGAFQHGKYRMVETKGARMQHVLSYLREHEKTRVLVVTPRLCAQGIVAGGGALPLVTRRFWQDTKVLLSKELGAQTWVDIFTGAEHGTQSDGSLLVSRMLSRFPVAVLIGRSGIA